MPVQMLYSNQKCIKNETHNATTKIHLFLLHLDPCDTHFSIKHVAKYLMVLHQLSYYVHKCIWKHVW